MRVAGRGERCVMPSCPRAIRGCPDPKRSATVQRESIKWSASDTNVLGWRHLVLATSLFVSHTACTDTTTQSCRPARLGGDWYEPRSIVSARQ
jgi:hypothetical protein